MKNRKTMRLKNYNYSQMGCYFVTICTKDRIECFGKICDEKIELNSFGRIAQKVWQAIPEHFENVLPDEFIIMPNHVHGILTIEVGNRHACSLAVKREHQTLPVVIGSYKSAVTKQINEAMPDKFYWQRSFFDHVIRSDEELNKVREYIIGNPRQWDKDIENKNMTALITVKNYYEQIIAK